MFLGEYQHTLDPKGRLILPSAFREDLQEGLVMAIGADRCLQVHPAKEWERVVENLRMLRTTDRRERMYARMLTSSAHADSLDRQGRVTIPGRLREYASLQKDVIVVGADTRIEVWNAPAWEEYRERAMADFASVDEPFDLGGMF